MDYSSIGEVTREFYRRQGEQRLLAKVEEIIQSGEWSGETLGEDIVNLVGLIRASLL